MNFEIAPTPYCTAVTCHNGVGFGGANLVNFATINPAQTTATFLQLTNTSGTWGVTVQLNGLTTAQFVLAENTTQSFSHNDLVITSVDFSATTSGSGTVIVDIIAGVC